MNTKPNKKRRRPGTPKGFVPKRKHRTPYKAPTLSAQDRAALENMKAVTVRTISKYPTHHNEDDYPTRVGWMGEYSIRSSNNNRR